MLLDRSPRRILHARQNEIGDGPALQGGLEYITCGRRTRYVLRILGSEVHPSRIHGLKHFFGRSGLALGDAELLERRRPPGPRDGESLDIALHDFTQLSCDLIRADHRAELDNAMLRPRRPGQQRRHFAADVFDRDHCLFTVGGL